MQVTELELNSFETQGRPAASHPRGEHQQTAQRARARGAHKASAKTQRQDSRRTSHTVTAAAARAETTGDRGRASADSTAGWRARRAQGSGQDPAAGFSPNVTHRDGGGRTAEDDGRSG